MSARVYGSLYGVCVGDAIGATLEFLGHLPTDSEIESAVDMMGGGALRLVPGQVTDDSEMMICLLHSIVEDKPAIIYYKKWYNSKPIDIGNTCSRALAGMSLNTESKANGALMRCAPIGALNSKLMADEIAIKAMVDAKLTHPNMTCQYGNAVYCIAIARLVAGDSHLVAFETAKNWLGNKNSELTEWLNESMKKKLVIDPTNNIGFMKYGFIMAFWHLYHNTDFMPAIIDTIRRGGDTDTNAAIVGGLIGANKPHFIFSQNVFDANRRPEWLSPSAIKPLLQRLRRASIS